MEIVNWFILNKELLGILAGFIFYLWKRSVKAAIWFENTNEKLDKLDNRLTHIEDKLTK